MSDVGAAGATRVAPSGEQFELAYGEQRATVVEVGGALRRYAVADWEVLDGYAEDEMCSAARGQALIPWPNRLQAGRFRFGDEDHQLPLSEPEKGNAIHGLVRWANWTAVQRGTSSVAMGHRLHPRDGYPFALDLTIAYELTADGLSVTTSATNVGEGSCPYGCGAHPYLTLGSPTVDPVVVRAPGRRRLTTDERQIPTGSEPVDGTPFDFREPRAIGATELDTAFGDLERGPDGLARVEMSLPDSSRRATLWVDAAYGHLMLFTGDSLPQAERRRRSLGIEPMTCAPNALRSGDGLRVLEPGESAVARWGISTAAGDQPAAR